MTATLAVLPFTYVLYSRLQFFSDEASGYSVKILALHEQLKSARIQEGSRFNLELAMTDSEAKAANFDDLARAINSYMEVARAVNPIVSLYETQLRKLLDEEQIEVRYPGSQREGGLVINIMDFIDERRVPTVLDGAGWRPANVKVMANEYGVLTRCVAVFKIPADTRQEHELRSSLKSICERLKAQIDLKQIAAAVSRAQESQNQLTVAVEHAVKKMASQTPA